MHSHKETRLLAVSHGTVNPQKKHGRTISILAAVYRIFIRIIANCVYNAMRFRPAGLTRQIRPEKHESYSYVHCSV